LGVFNLTISQCNRISLYIHIPFCRKKCAYCDFFSVAGLTGNNKKLQKQVVKEIVKQLNFFYSRLNGPQIKTLYIGGGTPNILGPEELEYLFQSLNQPHFNFFGDNCERTIEANPEYITNEFIRLCRKNHINRISLGVQSFNNDHLSFLGRKANKREIISALKIIKRNFKDVLNLDLMVGIPGQDKPSIRQDLDYLSGFKPQHVSVYTLTVEEATPLHRSISQGLIKSPDKNRQDELWFYAHDRLIQAGYVNYEVSNFALPGFECLHNSAYWNLEPYMGIGPGAVSTLPGGQTGIIRLNNPKDIMKYLKEKDWGITEEFISPSDFFFETVMMGLRLKRGINKFDFKRRFKTGLEKLLHPLWQDWEKRKLAASNNSCYKLTDNGRVFLNSLLLEALDFIEKKPLTVSECSWP
jgi:oxygen-independent coproporphyrinogen-3 oxidase